MLVSRSQPTVILLLVITVAVVVSYSRFVSPLLSSSKREKTYQIAGKNRNLKAATLYSVHILGEAVTKENAEHIYKCLGQMEYYAHDLVRQNEVFDALRKLFSRLDNASIDTEKRADMKVQILQLVATSGHPKTVNFLKQATHDKSEDISVFAKAYLEDVTSPQASPPKPLSHRP